MRTTTKPSPPLASLLLAAVISAAPACARAAAVPPSTAPAPANRLATEKSPYLLQHAHNPVDWYPWGAEAFERAKREGKPVLLSVGYSTCHWCHVMERESFEDAEVAKLINDSFVAVKVDREERPDVDRVYMAFVQATNDGSGGWPMTVFLTPDRKPFFGATYFPPEDRGDRVGMKTLLPRIAKVWRDDRDRVVQTSDKVTDALRRASLAGALGRAAPVDAAAMARAAEQYAKVFDASHGGFGAAPKFPQPTELNFLFHHWRRTGDAKSRDMALQTLRSMAAGGMYDHLGGGFHRYSTDERWFLPHFEKMLYDQAQLACGYVDAYQVTRDPFFADVARGVLDYVLRDLTGPAGQFYSAEDADSATDPAKPKEKSEGAFYVWRADEVRDVLGADAAAVFGFHYGVKPDGNVDHDPHGYFPKKNVLSVARPVVDTARQFGKAPAEVDKLLADARGKLLAARDRRPRPHLDDKTLAAWNGLMISAFARAATALDEPRYAAAATRAASFLRDKLYDPATRTLSRRWRDGHADIPGFCDDYAFVTQGLLDLYESTLDARWLRLALDLQSKQDELFWDAGAGGYFTTSGADATLIARMKDDHDGAEPAANSIAALNLLRLSQMTDDAALGDRAAKALAAHAPLLARSPTAMPQMLVAADFHLDKPKQIVVAGKPDAHDTRAMLRALNARYLPNKVVLGADGGEGQQFLAARLPFLKTIAPVGGKATAYVCENYTCQLPTNDLNEFVKQLK